MLEQPFIDLQLVGDFEDMLPRAGGPYDFIYDNYGPIFWTLVEARQDPLRADRMVSSVLERLHEVGTLFVGASDGARLLERSLDRHTDAVQIRSGPIFAGAEIRTCILTRQGGVR